MSENRPPSAHPAASPPFAEAPAWDAVGAGWRPLFGKFQPLGFSFEWHDFSTAGALDWARSFHPGSVELCLNLEGTGTLDDGRQKVELAANTISFYFQGEPGLKAVRAPRQQHRFITVEFSTPFLAEHLRPQAGNLHPLIEAVIAQKAGASQTTPAERMPTPLQQLVNSLRHCPVFQPAQEVWFRCKALELAAQLFFRPQGGEMFCTRAQRAARERVERAQVLLRERMQDPPSLDELGKLVGCSPFYLSRLFSTEAGLTIQQFIRQVRLERAAELLRTGRCNVTEAALEVGYNSLSHFSTAFHAAFGCCPGLYPLKTPTQREADKEETSGR